jgi:hypothetical protein
VKATLAAATLDDPGEGPAAWKIAVPRVSKEHVGRAARILQAIADEAPRRGLNVLEAEQAKNGADQYHARMAGRWRLGLRSPAGVYGIRIQEVSASGGKPVDPIRRYRRRTRGAWLDSRYSEFVSTGILELILEGPGTAYDGDRFRDAKTIPVEGKLPRVFRAIEVHRLQAEWGNNGGIRNARARRKSANGNGRPPWPRPRTATFNTFDGKPSSNAHTIGTP